MRRLLRLCPILLTILAIVAPHPLGAAVPSTMSYQGVLTNDAGQPLPDGSYNLTFRLYATAIGGAAVWVETQNSVALSKGVFAVTLGSSTPLSLSFDNPLWLGISVGTDPELSPRTALAAAPYALGLRTPLPGIASVGRAVSGVAGNVNPGADALFRDLDLEITVQASGFVHVQATGFVQMFAVPAGTQQYVKYQLSETTGLTAITVSTEPGYFHWVGFEAAPNNLYFDWPVSIGRTFNVTPGTHRFSFCSGRLGSFTPTTTLGNLMLTAVYYPASYGAVMTTAPASESPPSGGASAGSPGPRR